MEHITRCPGCEIAFHVTDDQMQLAAGKVRCGACLTIFDARSHIESHLEESPADSGDELLIHDDMNPAAVVGDAPEEQTSPEAQFEQRPEPDSATADTPLLPARPVPAAIEHHTTTDPEPVIEPGCEGNDSVIPLGWDSSKSPLDSPLPDTPLPGDIAEECPFETPVRRRRPFLAAACVLALLLLAGQYLYFHFPQLAADPQRHRWLTSACELLGCQVPPLTDVTKIISARLVVGGPPHAPPGAVGGSRAGKPRRIPATFSGPVAEV